MSSPEGNLEGINHQPQTSSEEGEVISDNSEKMERQPKRTRKSESTKEELTVHYASDDKGSLASVISRSLDSNSRRYLVESTPENALENLKRDGYILIRSAIPQELCEQCAKLIQDDVGARLDKGSPHQEEPVERLNKSTVKVMVQIRDLVLENVLPHFVCCDESSSDSLCSFRTNYDEI